MRQFVVVGHEAPTDADVALNDLASGAGRLDLLARSLLAGLLLSHTVRDDTRVHLVHADELTLTFDGSEIRSLHPDERSAAALIRSALEHADEAVGRMAVEPSPGVSLRRSGFEDTLDTVADKGTVICLHPDGTRASDAEPPSDPVFVLSDNRPFEAVERERLEAESTFRLSLGPRTLHTDQSINIAHNWCDTGGWSGW
jgi:tRNA (pseudouridine54-N1)-methyltransferase